MSQDNADDLLPSGYNAAPPAVGETDIGVPTFHEALWLALSDLRDVDTGAYVGLAYRLMWGSLGGGDPHLDGELWIDTVQMEGLIDQYLILKAKEGE